MGRGKTDRRDTSHRDKGQRRPTVTQSGRGREVQVQQTEQGEESNPGDR